MANRRIKDLTPQAAIDNTFLIAVDKAGQTEATSVELSALSALLTGLRTGRVACNVDADTTVNFSTTFASASYSLVYSAWDTNGNSVAVVITSRAATGFHATCAATCLLSYIAIAI